MSRIFDALKNAQVLLKEKSALQNRTDNPMEVPDRRRSRRLAIDVPVYVYGHGPGKGTFHEEAHTFHVSSNGASLLLSGPVEPGDKLLLTNEITQREQDCVVIYLGTRHQRTTEVGVAFTNSNPNFWQVTSEDAKNVSTY